MIFLIFEVIVGLYLSGVHHIKLPYKKTQVKFYVMKNYMGPLACKKYLKELLTPNQLNETCPSAMEEEESVEHL